MSAKNSSKKTDQKTPIFLLLLAKVGGVSIFIITNITLNRRPILATSNET